MSEAVKLIVDTYVSLKNREGLEAIREHRQLMRDQLREKSGGAFDVSKSIRTCDDEIAIVEQGLDRL